jgi:glutamyl-tRNA reductase
MGILLVGLNHKTASVDIREQLAFDEASTIDALTRLKERYPAGEFVLLSTCNRVELYCAAGEAEVCGAEELARFLSDYHNVAFENFQRFLYISHNEDCVRHLLTVTSSLDSMVVGEPQITAQVKESYRFACEVESSGKVLNRLFHCAFNTSKDIYTRTSITNRRVSVAGVSVELAKQLFSDIASAKIVVIGAGEMGELLVEHLLGVKCNDITVVNRSGARAQKLAERLGIVAGEWANLHEQLTAADIVVAAATATQGYLFDKTAFKKIMEARRGRTLLIIDIAVPRNFEPAVNEIENVYLYSIDDLAQVVEQNISLREDDIDEAVQIICEKVSEFMDWFGSRDIGPIIGKIKRSFEQIRQNELERFFVGNRREADCKEIMEAAVGRIVNKLLNCVIRNINVVAKEQGSTEAAKLADSIIEQAQGIAAEVRNQGKPQT